MIAEMILKAIYQMKYMESGECFSDPLICTVMLSSSADASPYMAPIAGAKGHNFPRTPGSKNRKPGTGVHYNETAYLSYASQRGWDW